MKLNMRLTIGPRNDGRGSRCMAVAHYDGATQRLLRRRSTKPVYARGGQTGRQEIFAPAHDHRILLGNNLQYVTPLARGKAQTLALTDGEVLNPLVRGQYGAGGIDDLARGRGL